MILTKICYNKQKDVVMKKLKYLLLSFILIPCMFLFAACDNGEPYNLTIEEVYSIVQERGYDGSFDEFIESIKGEDGKGIESVEKVSSTDETDVYAIVFSDSSVINFTITNGKDGNGISAISKTNSSYAQDGRLVNEYTILYTNGETYTFVVSDGLNGENGVGIASIIKTNSEGNIDTYTITLTNGNETSFTITNGIDGEDGVGIKTIAKTSTDGLTDIYTITYTDETFTTFTVTNGKDGQDGKNGNGIKSISKTSTDGLTDTYTITLTDGSTTTFTITNGKNGQDGVDGEDGVGIKLIVKTATDGLIDTYTITYTDNSTSNFSITNGQNGVSIVSVYKTKTEGNVDTYTITFSDGSESYFTITNGQNGTDGEDGRGILTIAKTSSEGLVDIYTITYSDGTYSTFTVTNGEDGIDGVDGEDGLSAYEIYISYFPEYNKSEKEWIIDLINGNLQTVEPKTYTVTFDSNGGSDVPSQSGIIYAGKATKPEDPVKNGYIFDGWWIEGERWSFVGYSVTEDITLVAKWENVSNIITFDANGGILDNSSMTVYYNEYYSLPTPQKLGYEFKGWYSNNIKYNDGIWLNKQDIQLIAKWEIVNYTITYHLDSGYQSEDNIISYTVNDSVTFYEPSKNGFKFLGWFNEETFSGNKVENLPIGTTGNIELYAKWEAETYNISLILNGGECDVDTITVKYGQSYELPTPTKTNYTFKSWLINNSNTSTIPNSGVWLYDDITSLSAEYKCLYIISNNILTDITDKNLSILEIPESVDGVAIKGIGDRAFRYCDNLKTVTIPNSIETIGDLAFSNCDSIIELTIGENVKSIGNYAFAYLDNIQVLNYNAINVEQFELEPLQSTNVFESFGLSNEDGVTVNIGNKVKFLPKGMFNSVHRTVNITSLNFAENGSLATISAYSFEGIPIKTLYLPNSIETIGDYAFYDCDSIIELTIGENVKSIGNYAFAYLDNIQVLNYNAINVEQFELEPLQSTNVFESFGLSNEDGVTVNIGNKVKFLPKGMFNCVHRTANITSLNFAENGSLATISAYSFKGIPIKTLYLPNSIETIGDLAFKDCDSIIELTIGKNVKSIGYGAFSDCVNLKTVTIPNSIETIGDFAFRYCYSIIELTIGENVKSIGNYAFAYLYNIQVLNYNAIDVEQFELEGHQSTNVFESFGLSNEDGVTVNIGNKVKFLPKGMFNGGEGVANITSLNFAENGSPLTISAYSFVGIPIKILYLPSYIEIIGHRAFVDCRKLEEIYYDVANLNSTVEIEDENGSGIFSYDSEIFAGVGNTSKSVDVVIGENVQSLPERLFNYSYAFSTYITSIDFSKNNFLYQIPSNMGNSLYKLEYIVLPNNLVNFGDGSFENCTVLTNIYYLGIESESLNIKFPDKTIYYYIENEEDVPVDGGNYWHYVDGIITIW